MKKIGIILFLALVSCTIHRHIKITYKSNKQLIDYYEAKNISTFLTPKDYASFLELNTLNRITIPQNVIFDVDGHEIEHFNDKLCVNHTLEFLKQFNETTVLKKTDFTIDQYIKYFKPAGTAIDLDSVKNSKKIRVFVNTATYGEIRNANEEALQIYSLFKGKYEVYIVNLDLNSDWPDKP